MYFIVLIIIKAALGVVRRFSIGFSKTFYKDAVIASFFYL